MSDYKTAESRDDVMHDRFVRWQKATREQLSYAINLLLISAGAVVGFEVTTSFDDRFVLTSAQRWTFLTSLVFVALSMVPGIAAVVTRLQDFRVTTRVARMEWKSPKKSSEIDSLRAKARLLGNASWCLFYIQALTFGIGTALAAVVFFLSVASQSS